MDKNIGELLGKYIAFRQPPEKGVLYGKVTSVEKQDGFWFLNVKGLHQKKYGKPKYHLPPEGMAICTQEQMFMLGAKYGSSKV